MGLSDRDRERLADIVELQPTKNGELADRWGMESGSEVHAYLEEALSEHYYRDDRSLIRATPEAAELVDVAPGVEADGDELILRVPELEQRLLDVLPAPTDRSISAVAALKALRAEFDLDPSIEDVRSGLQHLRRKDAIEVTYRIVPTYSLARPRAEIQTEAPRAGA